MNKLFELLREDLRKKLININEINIPSMRLPKNRTIDSTEIENIRNIKWQDLIITDEGNDGVSKVHMGVNFPWKTDLNNSIVVDIQIINDSIYHPHISISDNMQRLGLGKKIYVALINDLGHLYTSNGRRQNKLVMDKIWDKLGDEPNISCVSNTNGKLCYLDNNPNKDVLLSFMGVK